MPTKELVTAKLRKAEITEKMNRINFNSTGISERRLFLLTSMRLCLEQQLETIEEQIAHLETPPYTWGRDDELP